VATHEIAWERYTDDWLRTSFSAYRYRAEQLITLVADESAFLGATFVDTGPCGREGIGGGSADAATARHPRDNQFSLQRADDTSTARTCRIRRGTVSRSVPAGRSVSTLRRWHSTSSSSDLGARDAVGPCTAVTADLTFNVPVSRRVWFSASAYNFFDATYADPASDAHRQEVIPQNGRTLRAGLRVTLGR
jgi:hypothetical protein